MSITRFVDVTAGIEHVEFGGSSLAGATFVCIDVWRLGDQDLPQELLLALFGRRHMAHTETSVAS